MPDCGPTTGDGTHPAVALRHPWPLFGNASVGTVVQLIQGTPPTGGLRAKSVETLSQPIAWGASGGILILAELNLVA